MQKKEIDRTFAAFNNYVIASRLKDAIEILQLLAFDFSGFSDNLMQINDVYHNMLKYKFMGVEDPQQEKIYTDLKLNLYELSDRMKQKIFETGRLYNLNTRLESISGLSGEVVRGLFETFAFDSELSDIFVEPGIEDEKTGFGREQMRKKLISNLFLWLWFGPKLSENDKNMVLAILGSDKLEWYEKSLVVSALTMGLLKGFDVYRFEVLFAAYDLNIPEISQRAFTGLLLGLYFYDHRLYLYPSVINRLKAMQGDEFFELDAMAVIFQLMKSKDTDKVTKKLHDEIMPDIIKIAPGFEDKLGLDQMFSDEFTEDKNPKWKQLFEDSPDLINKLEELTRMQLEGMDVFMSTFSNLKQYPFFNEISNWLVPFHLHHKEIEKVLESEDDNFREVLVSGLNLSLHMCNSDKYSFCLGLGMMPPKQKEMVTQMFNAEMEGMRELEAEENILDSRKKINSVYTQYIQDLYRFFKLHPDRQELDDIFISSFDFHNKEFMQHIVTNNSSWRNFADFYFEREYYQHALDIYMKLRDKGDTSQLIFEKIAYCYEKSNLFDDALIYYRKAELFDENRVWNLRKIARILWTMKKYEESIAAYKEAEALDPENIHLTITIGNCYLHIKDFSQALNYYYKVELASPDNIKVLRPIAWCLFVNGKLSESKYYYEKLMEDEPTKYDYMNLAHVFLCMNETNKAIDCYMQSLKQKDNSVKQFVTGFEEDIPYLTENGVNPDGLPVLLDYIKYKFEQNS